MMIQNPYTKFQQAWKEAVALWQMGVISYDQLLEYGTLDEYMEYMEEYEEACTDGRQN